MTIPTPARQLALDVQQKPELDKSANQSANSNRIRGNACVLNALVCAPSEFASCTLEINWNDEFNRFIAERGANPPYAASFTDDYQCASDGHFKIKVIWKDGFLQVIDSQGRLDGVNIKNMAVGPPGLGQAGK